MQVLDIKELVRSTKGISEEMVQEAVDTIRRVEQLGGTRSVYNLVPPFSRQPSAPEVGKKTDPRTVKLTTRRP